MCCAATFTARLRSWLTAYQLPDWYLDPAETFIEFIVVIRMHNIKLEQIKFPFLLTLITIKCAN